MLCCWQIITEESTCVTHRWCMTHMLDHVTICLNRPLGTMNQYRHSNRELIPMFVLACVHCDGCTKHVRVSILWTGLMMSLAIISSYVNPCELCIVTVRDGLLATLQLARPHPLSPPPWHPSLLLRLANRFALAAREPRAIPRVGHTHRQRRIDRDEATCYVQFAANKQLNVFAIISDLIKYFKKFFKTKLKI